MSKSSPHERSHCIFQPGRPDEFVKKIAQNFTQPIFVKINTYKLHMYVHKLPILSPRTKWSSWHKTKGQIGPYRDPYLWDLLINNF
jgi:hypothetical protein